MGSIKKHQVKPLKTYRWYLSKADSYTKNYYTKKTHLIINDYYKISKLQYKTTIDTY